MEKTFEDYLEMAKAYLVKKERKNYYESKGISDPHPDLCGMYVELSDDEVAQIRALKERYGKEFISHLNEVFDDPDCISDMFYGEPVDIDTEYIWHQYEFTIREVQGEKVWTRKILVELNDEEYSKLLAWHLWDSHLVMNTLFYRDQSLCKRIMREAMRYCCDEDFPLISAPFVVTMEEALADAEQIMKENNLTKDEGYRALIF